MIHTINNNNVRETWNGAPLNDDELVIRTISFSHTLGFTADAYASKEAAKVSKELSDHKIMHRMIHVRSRIISPRGSGPRGMVRAGDNWMPCKYLIVIKKDIKEQTEKCLSEYDRKKREYLDNIRKEYCK